MALAFVSAEGSSPPDLESELGKLPQEELDRLIELSHRFWNDGKTSREMPVDELGPFSKQVDMSPALFARRFASLSKRQQLCACNALRFMSILIRQDSGREDSALTAVLEIFEKCRILG